MTAITATMCSTAQRQGLETTQTGCDSVCHYHAPSFMWGKLPGPESLTCSLYCQHRRHVCLVSFLYLGSHVMQTNTYPTVSPPGISIYFVIFLPRAVSNFTSNCLFGECSLAHYQVLPRSIMSLEAWALGSTALSLNLRLNRLGTGRWHPASPYFS